MESRNIWFFWLGIFVVVAGLIWALKFQVEKQVAIKLPDWVFQASKGRYQAHISKIEFDIFPLGMQIDSVVLEPTNDLNPNKIVVGLQAKTIRLSGFKLFSYLQDNKLRFDKLETQDMQIIIGGNPKKTSKSTAKDTTTDKGIQYLSIDKIRLGPAQLVWQSKSPLSLKNLNISLDNFIYQKDQPLYIGKYLAKLDSLNYHLPDGLHRATIEKLTFSQAKGLDIVNLSILPLIMDRANFFRLADHQTDRFELENLMINLKGFSLEKLLENKIVEVQKLDLSKGRALIMRDKRYAKSAHLVPLLPMQALKKMTTELQIHHFTANIPLLEYREFDTKNEQPGIVKFENLWVQLDSLNTKNSQGTLAVLAAARIQGRVKLNLKLFFDYANPNFFRAKGNVSRPFEAAIFNAAAYPLGGIKISNGRVNHLDFDFLGSSASAKGQINLQYQDLRIETTKAAIPQLPKAGHKIISELADELLFKTSNPMPGQKIRIGNIDNPRTNNSFLNYLWKSLFNGIKDAIDLPDVIKNKKPKK